MNALPRDAEKPAAVEAMFDRIAPRYDLMNRVISLGMDRSWRRAAVRSLGIASGTLVIDLACGTGDLMREAARKGARVLGVDFSEAMLRRASERLSGGEFIRADALHLPLKDSCCDALVSGFALRNFADLRAAFTECARVLRPGAPVALLEVDSPIHPIPRLLHRVYFHHLVPLLGALIADRQAYAYLPSSVVYLPEEKRMLEMLRSAGFEALKKRSLLFGAAQLITGRRLSSRWNSDGR